MAQGFNVSEVTGFVDENSFDLISKTILTTDLANNMSVRVGLKGDVVAIPLLGGAFNPASGLDCGFQPSADEVEITQVSMTLANKKFNQAYCPQVLRDTFLSQSLAAGALGANESLSFSELMANYFVENLKKWNEGFIINGDGAIDGLHGIITAVGSGSALQSTLTPAAWDSTNAIAQAQSLALAVPDAVADATDLLMVVSPASYRALKLNITQADYYHIAPSDDVYVPGTSIKVVSSSGLVGATADFKFVARSASLILGSDLTSDFEQFKLMYSESDDQLRAIMRWRIGVSVTETNMTANNGL